MILADKLLKLRTLAGLSQEEAAEKLGVSRQSVSKWESGASIPGMDKIVEISRVYGVSTDYLLLDEVEEVPGEIIAEVPKKNERKVSLEQARAFLDLAESSAKKVAFGVFLCVFSPVPMMAMLTCSEMGRLREDFAGAVGVALVLPFVAYAVMLFLSYGVAMKPYAFLETEDFQLEYGVAGIIQREWEIYVPHYQKGLGLGVALCVVAAMPMLVAGGVTVSDYWVLFGLTLCLMIVSVGVYFIVRVCMRKGFFDKLLQEGDYSKKQKRSQRTFAAFHGIYWSIVTAVYLAVSFLTMRWDKTWIIWPVCGVLSGAVTLILQSLIPKDTEE